VVESEAGSDDEEELDSDEEEGLDWDELEARAARRVLAAHTMHVLPWHGSGVPSSFSDHD